jgi:hypothetical protein
MIYVIKNGKELIFPKDTKILPDKKRMILVHGMISPQHTPMFWCYSHIYVIEELLLADLLTIHINLNDERGTINVRHLRDGYKFDIYNVTFIEKAQEKKETNDYLQKIAKILDTQK